MLLVVVTLGCVPKVVVPPTAPAAATLVQLSTGTVAAPDREAVLRAVATAPVRPCFETLLAHTVNAYGEVVVRFTVSPAGLVESATPEFSTLGDDIAAQCVADAVKSVTFPNRDTAITVVYPFLLLTERTPPEVARALRDRYGLLTADEKRVGDDPRDATPPGVIVVW